MKKYSFILAVVVLALVSCSKEQPLTPINSTETVEPQMIKATEVFSDDVLDDTSNDTGITDPEKEDKEKTNKNAKN